MEQKEMIRNLRMMRAELQESEGVINSLLYRVLRYTDFSEEDFPPIIMKHWIGDWRHFPDKKPLAVIFGDGHRVVVTSWKETVWVVLQDCETDYHEQLVNLCGRVSGRQRAILVENPDKLQTPMKIGEKIYMEAKFDTDSLLRIMTERILDAVGYDYGNIQVEYQD